MSAGPSSGAGTVKKGAADSWLLIRPTEQDNLVSKLHVDSLECFVFVFIFCICILLFC